MKRFLKTVISFTLALYMCTPFSVLANANNVINNFEEFSYNLESISDVEIKIVDTIPENVTPKKFDTWDDAYEWLSEVVADIDTHNTNTRAARNISTMSLGDLNDGFDFVGEKGSCIYKKMPSGSGSYQATNTYVVPGMSGQKVTANYFFQYDSKLVTNSSASADISGIGISNYVVYYNELQEYGAWFAPNYYRVILGHLGTFLNIGGTNVGITQILELDYCLYNTNYIIAK